MGAVKKALVLFLVVLVVVTGIPVPAAGMGSMDGGDCPAGMPLMSATCLAIPPGAVVMVTAVLLLAFGMTGRRGVGRSRAAPPLRPPRLA